MTVDSDLSANIGRLHRGVVANRKRFIGANGLLKLLEEASVETGEAWIRKRQTLPPALNRLSDAEYVVSRLRTQGGEGYAFLLPILVAWGYLVILARCYSASGEKDFLTYWQESFPQGIAGLPGVLILTLFAVLTISWAQGLLQSRVEISIADLAEDVAIGIREHQRLVPIGGVDEAASKLANVAAQLAKAAEALRGFNEQADSLNEAMEGMLQVAGGLSQAGSGLAEAAERFGSASSELAPAVEGLKEELEAMESLGTLILEKLDRADKSLEKFSTDQSETTGVLRVLQTSAEGLSGNLAEVKVSAQQMENLGAAMEKMLAESRASLGEIGPACAALSRASGIVSTASGRLESVLAMLDDPDYRAEPTGVRR